MTTHSAPHWMDALDPLFEPSIASRDVATAIVALTRAAQPTPLHHATNALCVAQIVTASPSQGGDFEVVIASHCVVRLIPKTTESVESVRGLARMLSLALRTARAREARERRWMTDALTGLYRRDAMMDVLKQQAEHGGVVVFLDLIGFKSVNDHFGHAAGDQLLAEFAQILRAFFRASDVLFRYGGDEFLILCPDANAEALGNRLDALRVRVQSHHEALDVRIGLAAYSTLGALPQAIEVADRAMYGTR